MKEKKPVFLILDFHYGFFKMNKASLEGLGYKTYSICGSGHYLAYEYSSKAHLVYKIAYKILFKLKFIQNAPESLQITILNAMARVFEFFVPSVTEYVMGAFLQQTYSQARVHNEDQCREYVDNVFLKGLFVKETILKCDYIVCSFFPKLVGIAVKIAQRYDKKIFFLAGHRFNIHLKTEEQNRFIKKTIQELAKHPKHVVGVYGEYETQYMKYFLPNLQFYTFPLVTPHIPLHRNMTKRREKTDVFIYYCSDYPPWKPIVNKIKIDLSKKLESITLYDKSEARKSLPQFSTGKDAHPMCLTYFDAIICFPYSAYSCLFCEMYELNVPIFVPSVEFLIEAAKVYGCEVHDRALYKMYCSENEYKKMEPGDDPQRSPNSYHADALKIWLPRMEYYQRKNVVTFDGIEDLSAKLIRTDFREVSAAMYEENKERREKSKALWQTAINQTWQHAQTG